MTWAISSTTAVTSSPGTSTRSTSGLSSNEPSVCRGPMPSTSPSRSVSDQEHRAVGRVVDEVAQQAERRVLGPLEVVEDEEDRPPAGDRPQPVAHRVEQPHALGVGVVGQRWAHPADAGADVGEQASEVVGVGVDVALQQPARAGGGVAAHRLADRLVGGEGLLVPPPVEHHAAPGVHPQRLLGGERGLADAGVARQHHDAVVCPPAPRPTPPRGGRAARAAPRRGGRPPGAPTRGSRRRRRRRPRAAPAPAARSR